MSSDYILAAKTFADEMMGRLTAHASKYMETFTEEDKETTAGWMIYALLRGL